MQDITTPTEQARAHLAQLEAFDKPNPVLAMALTMRRLTDEGIDDNTAAQAVRRAMMEGAAQ